MIALPPATRVWLACGATDMRKGMCGLAVLAQEVLKQKPHSGAVFAFRGKRGDLVKLLWYDGQGMCLFSKRIDRGKFVWSMTQVGVAHLSAAQLSMLLEGPIGGVRSALGGPRSGLIIGRIPPFSLARYGPI